MPLAAPAQAYGVPAFLVDGTPGAGGIAQTFATTFGRAYLVTFDFSGNPEGGDPVKHMRVEAPGQSQDYEFDTTGHSPTDLGWRTETFRFTATDSLATVEFFSLSESTSSWGPLLDNVVVTEDSGN